MREEIGEFEVVQAAVTAAIHKAPKFVLDLGTDEEFALSAMYMEHDMRLRSREGNLEYVCVTCETAEEERTAQ
jgi:hypothetical protein